MEYDYSDYEYIDCSSPSENVKIMDKMFFNPDYFPWNWYYGKPMFGSVFSYICRYAALIETNGSLKYILEHNPTTSEIKKFEEDCHSVKAILNYIKSLESIHPIDRRPVANEVLDFLRTFPGFYTYVENDYNYRKQHNRLD